MTVSNTDSSITYTGNGATTVFPYAFLIPTNADAEVVVFDSTTMIETTLTVGVDCTISGIGSDLGGNVTYNPGVAIPATKLITIRRVLDITQTLDLTRQSNFDPTSLESELDRIVMMIQQINTTLDQNTITIPTGSGIDVNDILNASAAAVAAAGTASAAALAAAASAVAAATFNPAAYAALAGAIFTGAVTGLTRAVGDSTTNFATTAWAQTEFGQAQIAQKLYLWSRLGGL